VPYDRKTGSVATGRVTATTGTRQRPQTALPTTATTNVNTRCSLGNARPRQPPPPPPPPPPPSSAAAAAAGSARAPPSTGCTTPQRPCRRRAYHCVRVRRSVRVTVSDRVYSSVCASVRVCVCVCARARAVDR